MSTNPFTLEKQPDGKVHIKYETGEEFTGDPLEVTQKIAEAHVNTKKWAQGIKQENDTLKAHPPEPKKNDPPTPTADPNEAQLQNYLVEQWAKGLGFASGAEAKQQLGKMTNVTGELENQMVATAFLNACPDFPNTQEAIDAISKIMDDNKWDYRPQDMMAAHMLAVREGKYKALTVEEQNRGWETRMTQANSQQRTPPVPPPAGATINNDQPKDEWSVPLDELRKDILNWNAAGKRAESGDPNKI